MSRPEPKTLSKFQSWLEDLAEEFELTCQYAEPDEFEQFEIGQKIEQASRLACRFGLGELIGTEQFILTPRAAFAIIGRILAGVREKTVKPKTLLSVKDVAQMLDVSTRTVRRMVSAGELPQPVKVGNSTKWRRDEIQSMIDLLPAVER